MSRGTTPRNMIINQLVGGSIKLPIRNRTCENKSNHKDPRMFFIRLFFSIKANQYPNSVTFWQNCSCAPISHIADPCQLLARKYIGKTTEQGDLPEVEWLAFVDSTSTLWERRGAKTSVVYRSGSSHTGKSGLKTHSFLFSPI